MEALRSTTWSLSAWSYWHGEAAIETWSTSIHWTQRYCELTSHACVGISTQLRAVEGITERAFLAHQTQKHNYVTGFEKKDLECIIKL